MSVDCLQQSTQVDYKTYCSRLFASSFSSAAIWFAFSLWLWFYSFYIIYALTHAHTDRCVYTYLLYMHCVTYFDALQRNQFWYSHNSCPTWKDFWCAAPLPADKTATVGQEKGKKKGQEKRIRKQELHHNIHTSIVCDKTLLYEY